MNRLPTAALNNKVPYELLFEEEVDYTGLRVFGCLAMMANPEPTTDKFARKAVPCVFLGYPSLKKGYKFLNLLSNTTFVSRDAEFHEDLFPFNSADSKPYMNPLPVSMPPPSPVYVDVDDFVAVHPPPTNNITSHNITPADSASQPDITSPPPPRRSQRNTKPPSWLQEYTSFVTSKATNIAQSAI